jgi:hypothetical protein
VNDRTLDITSFYSEETTDQQVVDNFDMVVLDRKPNTEIVINQIETVEELIQI